MIRFGWLFLLFLSAWGSPVVAGEIVQQRGAARLQIRWDAAEQALGLADWITVTLTVEGPTPLPAPTAPLQLGTEAKWLLVTRSALARDTTSAGQERCRLTYRFAPREPGKIEFAFPDVRYRQSGKDESVVAWDTIWFEVKRPTPAGLRDITDVETPAPVELADPTWVFWVSGITVFLLTVGGALIVLLLLRQKAVRSHEEVALAALHRLLAKRIGDAGKGKRLITLLHLLVRIYLERRFLLPLRRRTTPECAQFVEECPHLSVDERRFLLDFFSRSDAVKFAPMESHADECRKWGIGFQEFLERRAGRGKQGR